MYNDCHCIHMHVLERLLVAGLSLKMGGLGLGACRLQYDQPDEASAASQRQTMYSWSGLMQCNQDLAGQLGQLVHMLTKEGRAGRKCLLAEVPVLLLVPASHLWRQSCRRGTEYKASLNYDVCLCGPCMHTTKGALRCDCCDNHPMQFCGRHPSSWAA